MNRIMYHHDKENLSNSKNISNKIRDKTGLLTAYIFIEILTNVVRQEKDMKM